jgi:hypothetical protein
MGAGDLQAGKTSAAPGKAGEQDAGVEAAHEDGSAAPSAEAVETATQVEAEEAEEETRGDGAEDGAEGDELPEDAALAKPAEEADESGEEDDPMAVVSVTLGAENGGAA